MKWTVFAIVLALALFAPSLKAQTSDHIEVGAFVDYFNLSRTDPNINYVGVGGRVGVNLNPNVQIEGEMAYDFERNFTTTFSNGASTLFVRTHTRPLTALFGPKLQTNRGPFRAFATFKVGFVNFSTTNDAVLTGFQGALGSVTSGNTSAAIYPGVGVEGFWGPFGLRLDVGDDIYFDGGAQNNLKITFGPTVRF
jgi:outer membrane protein with beta-barrel domain